MVVWRFGHVCTKRATKTGQKLYREGLIQDKSWNLARHYVFSDPGTKGRLNTSGAQVDLTHLRGCSQ